MKLNKNLVALLTLSSFVSAYSPAADQVRVAWSVGDIQKIASFYNAHRKVDSSFESTYFPTSLTKADPEVAAYRDYFKKSIAQAHDQIEELPKATAENQALVFHLEGEHPRSMTVDFSQLAAGSLLIDGHKIPWDLKEPAQKRLDRVHKYLEKDFEQEKSAMSWLIPEAHACIGPLVAYCLYIVIVALVGLIAALVIPHLKRGDNSAASDEMSTRDGWLDAQIMKCTYDTKLAKSSLALDGSGHLTSGTLPSDAVSTLKDEINDITSSSQDPFWQDACGSSPSEKYKADQSTLQKICGKLSTLRGCQSSYAKLVVPAFNGSVSDSQTFSGQGGTIPVIQISLPADAPAAQ